MERITLLLEGVAHVSVMVLSMLILVGFISIIVLYFLDTHQSQHAILRNYPVVGRLRYFFEHMGVFFRQYFFAMDREELPFNRAQRTWVARSAKNHDSTIAFGSTKSLDRPGEILFLNSMFPKLDEEVAVEAKNPIIFGEGYAEYLFSTYSFFNISAMSYGALSAPAIDALAHGAAQANIYLNTGEGALSPFHLAGDCDLVFQIGTAKYGVSDANGDLSNDRLRQVASNARVRMFEIKLSQGAKPGKGGILPKSKVTDVIAQTRGIPAGEDSISPNRHRDISCTADLLAMIHRVRTVTGKPTGIKFVLGQAEWIDEMCLEIHRMGAQFAPDFITLDSADGGTGAAPQSLMDTVGLPLNASLPILVDKLNEYGLRARIKVIASGKLVTPAAVAAALCLGADAVNSARGFMFALGCIQALQCNKNTCPTGITTHDASLQKGLDPTVKAIHVSNYAANLIHEVKIIAHSCGVLNPQDLGRTHAYIVSDQGAPVPLNKYYPDVATLPQYLPEANYK